jgi:hypothetical protein
MWRRCGKHVEEPIQIPWQLRCLSSWQEQTAWSFTCGKTGAISKIETFNSFAK